MTYQNAFLYEVDVNEYLLLRDLVVYPVNLLTSKSYTVTQSDTLYSIAYKFYKGIVNNPQHEWVRIADANNIFNPIDLTAYVGVKIHIPAIT
jgi:nucleoid-associated protein YgaU